MEAAEKAAQPVDLELPKDRKSRVVDLSNKELGRLPPELAEFSDLQLLTLKKNKLNTLGPEIGTPTPLPRRLVRSRCLPRRRLHEGQAAECQ